MNSDSHSPGDLARAAVSAEAVPPELGLRAIGSSLPAPAPRDVHILVVDDEPINIRIVQKFLTAGGYHYSSAVESGQQALDSASQRMPDVVLLDIFLGDINGIEVLKRLRTLPGGSRLPVVVLTASDDPDLKRCALDLGAVGFVTKPIHQGELIQWIQRSLPGIG